jgi:hypothetical protein
VQRAARVQELARRAATPHLPHKRRIGRAMM